MDSYNVADFKLAKKKFFKYSGIGVRMHHFLLDLLGGKLASIYDALAMAFEKGPNYYRLPLPKGNKRKKI